MLNFLSTHSRLYGKAGKWVFGSLLNKNTLIFCFFLVLSAVFWSMMTLNENYEEELDIPVNLTGVPRNAVMTGDLPDTVHIVVRDKGFTLMAYRFGRVLRPLAVKFSTYADEDKGKGVVPISEIQRQVQQQLYGSSKLVSLKPSDFDFYFTYGASKQVPVVFRGRVKAAKNYYVAHTEFMPSQVTVYANSDKIGQVKYVEIEPYNVQQLQDTVHTTVKLRRVRGLKMVPRQVRLSIYPDVLTEESVDVPVTAVNMPQGMVLRTFPSKVTVRFTVGVSQFRSISPDMFRVVVDYNEIAANPSDKCVLQLRGVPRTVSKAKLTVQTVDYLLEQQ